MNNLNNKFPIVLFVFRRPGMTTKVLKEIIRSKPLRLYIFADGPRNDGDVLMVDKTRKIVDELLKKEHMDIIKGYRKINFGSKRNIIEGLNEVFLHEEAVIVLEDDCLPSVQFFDFCNIALSNYKDDNKINTICGTNIDSIEQPKGNFVSKYFIPWGWALWKRTWIDYQKIRNNEISTITKKSGVNKFLSWYLFQEIEISRKGVINAWDYRMIVLQIIRGTYSLIPPVNLISNIGFGKESSNTFFKTDISGLQIGYMVRNRKNDIVDYEYNQQYDNQVVSRLLMTPISVAGLIARKYFPFLVRYIYQK